MSHPNHPIFIESNGQLLSEHVCDGTIPAELGGQPCRYSCKGQFPGLTVLAEASDKGNPGDLFPVCGMQQLANLGHWQGHNGAQLPENLLGLRLFKCRQGIWLVIPGLLDASPGELQNPEQELSVLTNDEYLSMRQAATDWQYLVVLAGGMACKSNLDAWLRRRYHLTAGAARTISNSVSAELPPFQISNQGVVWMEARAQRPAPKPADYLDIQASAIT